MKVKLGNICYLNLQSKYNHPFVVVKIDKYNAFVCAITTNQKKANFPGNVVLDVNEGNLPKLSIVEVSKNFTVDKMLLQNCIGSLDKHRINAILQGIDFVNRSFLNKDFSNLISF